MYNACLEVEHTSHAAEQLYHGTFDTSRVTPFSPILYIIKMNVNVNHQASHVTLQNTPKR